MPVQDAKNLGTVVRPARQRMGWTQEQLANKLGVDKGYISAIEIGTRRWPLQHTEALAEALGLDLVEMAVAAGMLPEKVRVRRTVADAFPDGDPMQELLALMQSAEYGDRKAVLDFARFQRSARQEVQQEAEAPVRGRQRHAAKSTNGE